MDEAQNYCDGVTAELGAWKAKLSDVVTKIDRFSSGDKEKFFDNFKDLHLFIEEMDGRIDALRNECQTSRDPSEIEMEAKLTEKFIY